LKENIIGNRLSLRVYPVNIAYAVELSNKSGELIDYFTLF